MRLTGGIDGAALSRWVSKAHWESLRAAREPELELWVDPQGWELRCEGVEPFRIAPDGEPIRNVTEADAEQLAREGWVEHRMTEEEAQQAAEQALRRLRGEDD